MDHDSGGVSGHLQKKNQLSIFFLGSPISNKIARRLNYVNIVSTF